MFTTAAQILAFPIAFAIGCALLRWNFGDEKKRQKTKEERLMIRANHAETVMIGALEGVTVSQQLMEAWQRSLPPLFPYNGRLEEKFEQVKAKFNSEQAQ